MVQSRCQGARLTREIRTMKALTLSLLLLSFIGPVIAQDTPPEIRLTRQFQETPLGEAVEFITTTGGFQVEIEAIAILKKIK